MITLPGVTSGTKPSANHGKADAAQADAAADIAGAGDSVDGAQGKASQGFVALLGNKLLSLAKQSDSAGQATDAAQTADTGQASKEKLNALLMSLDKPETLNALLTRQPGGKDAVKTVSDEKEDEQHPAVSLSDSDMQTLQALFAMLPPTATQPTGSALKSGEAVTESVQDKVGKQSTIGAMLTGDTPASADKTGKSLTASLNQSAAHAPDAPVDVASQTNTFQQVMSQVGKEADKDNSVAAPAAATSNTLLGATSAAVTPAAVSPFAATAATPQLTSQLGSEEWQQALGQQILMFSRNGQQSAELHLHPQDLGSIQISLKLDNDQAQLSMVSSHSHVRAALEAALPQLRTALAENGISLGQSNVSSDAFQQGQSFNGQQQQPRNSGGNTFSLTADGDADVTPLAVPASLQARASGNSAVDIFA
ncbi:flagellar hook-length control protein FliK [Erwinia sp. 9145]|uniref:flagellar hook-length control protein FliK n=1 Tax=Erwinia sp. 9145 TaxID=1500895 RepID=UPI00054FC34B|nr:flagellar hook-length control protein FliK [Erwinia sp. 9145]